MTVRAKRLLAQAGCYRILRCWTCASSIRVGATGGGIKKGPMVQQLGEELSTQMLACIITHHNAACGLSSDEGPQPDVVAEGEQHKPDEEQILEQLLDPDAEQ